MDMTPLFDEETGRIQPPHRLRGSWTLREYLESFGLALPPGRRITDAIMSPDGYCFFGNLSAEDGEKRFPWQEFLACTGEGIEPPHWTTPPPNDAPRRPRRAPHEKKTCQAPRLRV